MGTDPGAVVPVTAIMPIRLDCPERLANAMLTAKYLLDVLRFQKLIIVESDTSPKLLGSIVHPRLHWMYIQTDVADTGFHRSHVINTALPWVDTPTVALWDADGLVSPLVVAQSILAITSGQQDFMVPFTRMVFLKQHSAYGQEILQGRWPTDPMPQAEGIMTDVPGLIGLASTAYFRHVRGMSELFRAYGDEDIEFVMRIHALGGRAARLEGDALHLWHPTVRRNAPEALLQEEGKKQEMTRLRQMKTEDVQQYFGITQRPGEYVQLNRLISASPKKYKVNTLEYQIVEHCNLRCHNCNHLSPYKDKGFIDTQQVERDVALAAKNMDANLVWLLGGEPTLHPELGTLARIVKKHYKVGMITNGTLLHTLSDDVIKEFDCVRISVYPSVFKTDEKLLAFAKRAAELGVGRVESKPSPTFLKPYSDTIQTDEQARNVCGGCALAHGIKCYSIYKGYFYKCPPPLLIDTHAKKLKFDAFDQKGDGIPLDDPEFIRKLEVYVQPRTVLSACKICLGSSGPVAPHRMLTADEVKVY